MNQRFEYGLVLLLLVQILILWKIHTVPNSNTALMPILTPVSIEHERSFRKGDAVDIHQMIDTIHQIEPQTTPSSAKAVAQFVSDRKRMLQLRNRRHELNTNLMNSGIHLIALLDEQQWIWVQSQRDRVQSHQEEANLDALLIRWGQRD